MSRGGYRTDGAGRRLGRDSAPTRVRHSGIPFEVFPLPSLGGYERCFPGEKSKVSYSISNGIASVGAWKASSSAATSSFVRRRSSAAQFSRTCAGFGRLRDGDNTVVPEQPG